MYPRCPFNGSATWSRADLAALLNTVCPGRKRISVWFVALYWSMLLTTPSTVVRRVLAWVAVFCAWVALLPASTACWSASLAFVDAIWIPCCARESTSLIIFEFAAVSSSSSFTRSRIGWVCFWTYFLRAKGLILPQKPWRLSYCKGAFPVAVLPEVVDDCAELSVVVELAGCC